MSLKSIIPITRGICLFLKVYIAVLVYQVLAGLWTLFSPHFLFEDDQYEVLLTTNIQLIAGCLSFLVWIMFFFWLYRCNKNLRALSDQAMRFTPGWSVGWFFIPLANIIMPFHVIKEVWNVSHNFLMCRSSAFVSWWWGILVTSCFLNYKCNYAAIKSSTVIAACALNVLDLISILLTFTLISNVGKAYRQNFAKLETAASVYSHSKKSSQSSF